MNLLDYTVKELHYVYAGRIVTRLQDPYNPERTGIITDITRDEFQTSAVVLWDNDDEFGDMGFDNDHADFEDLGVEGAVTVYGLSTLLDENRWGIEPRD